MNDKEKSLETNPAIGGTWDELEKELFTPEEIAESDLRVALIGKQIKERQELEKGIDNLTTTEKRRKV